MPNNKKIIINVGRQLGAGGHDIGRLLAQEFEAKYYDRELLDLAARESGFSAEFFAQNDERKGFLKSLFHLHAPYVGDSNFYTNDFSQEGLFKFQSDAIIKAAEEGSCVFVGRCADYVLRDFKDVVNVFISASMDFRIGQIMARQTHLSREEVRRLIEQGEARRAEYYNYYTGKKWGYASSYDLCIDSSLLGLQPTAEIIAEFVRKKMER